MRYRIVSGTALVALVGLAVFPGGATADGGKERERTVAAVHASHSPKVRVIKAKKHDRSRPLRDLVPVFPSQKRVSERENPVPGRQQVAVPALGVDPVLQTSAPTAVMPAPTTSFDGLDNVDGYVPPDTNGDVGPNDYVESVNAAFAVYNKTGTRLYGPADINTLWTGFGGLCESTNDGDPIVQYDQLANRWLITQFAFDISGFEPVGPYEECVAISTSGDPTGSYYRYDFPISDTKLDDYPKIGVRPDGYFMAVNQFDDSCGGCFVGAAAVAFERAAMLQGQDAALVYFDLDTSFFSMLPADLDGTTAPAVGASEPFAQFDDNAWGYLQDQLEVWNFHADWTNPASSTFTSGGTIATAPFDSSICSSCVVQPGLGPSLDSLSDRLMYRLAYRRFSDHESLVVTHTVDVNGADRGGLRWLELRRTTGSWSLFQQGTYSPDSNTRWLGSAAMDQNGDLAIGYSVSGSGTNPSIRYAGRLAGDPAGQLTQGEATLKAGGGVQTGADRWGDYSSLSVDPSDDCTFWYANEYYATTSDYGWQTRIGAFKFPSCGPPPTINGFDPTSGEAGTSVAISGTHFAGATAVKFNGTNASFTVDDANDITATVPAGASDGPISVVALSGTATSAASFDVIVPTPTITGFSPPSGPVGTSVTITGTNLTGASSVTFNGTSATTFTVDSATQVTATVPSGATTGPIDVTTPGGVATSSSDFTVTVPAPTVSSFTPASGAVGTVVTVNGTNMAATTSVSFGGVAAAPTTVSSTQVKANVPAGARTGTIGVTNPGGTGLSVATFKVLPKLTSFAPASAAAGSSVTIAGSGFTDVSAVKFNGVAAGSFGVDSDHQITATVPGTATTGKLSVVTAGGTATSATSFLAVPTITGFSPGSAAAGTAVVVDGTGFGSVTSVKVNGVSASFTVLSALQVRLTVPAGASSGAISVTTAGGTATSGATFFVLPKVTGFTPSSAAVGATVTINGSAFGGATSVLFNGVVAIPATVTATKVTVAAPTDASTGKLTVVTGAGSGLSAATFKVLPKLTSFTPPSGPSGTGVTIAGSGFTDVTAVKFNGVAATSYSVDTSSQITATVPAMATTGKLSVVTAGGTATSASSFLAVPTISGFAPGSAAAGTTVLVDGTGFGGVTSVKVNGVAASFAVLSKLQVRLTVPTGASSGAISVTTAGGTATSAATLSVLPRVTSFTPSSAAVGATVTINGNAFGGTTNVLFNGVSAAPVTVTATKITVVVPADASTGKLTVLTAAGSGQSVGTFKVLPKLTSFSPGSGVVGSSVTISGSGFTDVSAVKFNGVAASTYTVDSSSQITAMVPLGASTGKISVLTAGGTAMSASSFIVTP